MAEKTSNILTAWRWYPLAAVALAFASQGAGATATQGLSTVYVFIQEELLLSRWQLGLITTSVFAAGTVTALPGGWALDRFTVRRVYPLMLGLMGLGFMTFSLGDAFWHILLTAAFMGALLPVSNPAASMMVLEWAPRRLRGLAMGLKQAAVPATGMASAALLPTLADGIGWRAVLLGLGSVALLAGLAVGALYRQRPAVTTADRERYPFLEGLRLVALDRRMLGASLVSIIMIGLFFVNVTYLILFLREAMGFSVAVAGLGLAAFHLSSVVGRIMWGVLSDGPMKGRRLPALLIIFSLASLVLLAMALLTPESPRALVWALVCGLGLTVAAFQGLFYTHIAEVVGPELTGTALGFNGTLLRFGPMAIPPAFGLMVDRADGNYQMAWVATAALALLAVLSLRLMAGRRA